MINEGRKLGRNKRYGLLIGLTVIDWILVGLMIWRVDPGIVKDLIIPNSYLPMGVLLFGGIFFLLSIILLSSVKALRWTIGIMLFVYLRAWGLGSIINGLLILGMLICLELYLWKNK